MGREAQKPQRGKQGAARVDRNVRARLEATRKATIAGLEAARRVQGEIHAAYIARLSAGETTYGPNASADARAIRKATEAARSAVRKAEAAVSAVDRLAASLVLKGRDDGGPMTARQAARAPRRSRRVSRRAAASARSGPDDGPPSEADAELDAAYAAVIGAPRLPGVA